ncbi:hypothetical protein [Kribbella yunnanensis]
MAATSPTLTFEADPQLAILSTLSDGSLDAALVGQVVERVILEASTQNVSTSLLDQVSEHSHLHWLINDPLGQWHRPQAVIRFGYDPAVPPTPRRPRGDVLLP